MEGRSVPHVEIERKFLVTDTSLLGDVEGQKIRQGYLTLDKERTVRVRVRDGCGTITVKGLTQGISRSEFEYEIPEDDARVLLDELCLRPLVEKTRYRVPHGGLAWEIDVFEGENKGLILAEVEMSSEKQEIELPSWIGGEVTGDPRYFNACLVKRPYTAWADR